MSSSSIISLPETARRSHESAAHASRTAIEPAPKAPPLEATDAAVVIVDKRSLIRDCLVRNLRDAVGLEIVGASSLEECVWLASARDVGLVLLSISGDIETTANQDLLERSREALPDVPILILCDATSPTLTRGLSDTHPNCCISTSMPLDVAIAAIRVVQSGRTLPKPVEASAPKADPAAVEPQKSQDRLREFFTARQIAVIEALRKGKANKIIAYELNMKESTVKVHVRNIMRRLRASNRTEVSYIASQLVSGRDPKYLEALRHRRNEIDEPVGESAP
jgi:DNA-binding NarL/FixJ family response regulator